MKAVILAAGMARRLAPLTDRTHKCLLDVGGRPLLARMLCALDAAGVAEAAIVVGHFADDVRRTAEAHRGRLRVVCVPNPDYTRGSVLSLHAAREHLAGGALVMDADVLFPRLFLPRLLASPHASAFLIDRGFEDTGEEVKYYTRGERVVGLGKKFVPESWDAVGEGVGFFKCGAAAAPGLVRWLEHVIAESSGLAEYEDAFNLLVTEHPVGWVDITGLPWTEIDFAEDLRRARDEVLPLVVRVDGG
jgi:choline kinase